MSTAAIKAHVALINAMLASADDKADEEEEAKEENDEIEEKEKESNEPPMTAMLPRKKCAIHKNGKCLMMEASGRRCKDLLLQLDAPATSSPATKYILYIIMV
jgi:hypothetical protein